MPLFGCQHKQLYRYGLGNIRVAVEYYKQAFDTDNTYKDALCSILQVKSWWKAKKKS